ncbi:MAG: hypothetical protein ACOYB4_03375 [Methyloceanibacter sp.]
MRHRATIAALGLLAIAAGGVPVFAFEDGSAAYIESLYAEQELLGTDARYSPPLAALWKACEERAEAEGYACMDFDMFVMGNDFELTDFMLEEKESGVDRAVVEARFKNFGKANIVTFHLLRDGQGWMIDEIVSSCLILSRVLKGAESNC